MRLVKLLLFCFVQTPGERISFEVSFAGLFKRLIMLVFDRWEGM